MSHTVTILFIGDTPPSVKLLGVTVYPIGGEETWKELEESYNSLSDVSSVLNQSPAGFHL
jgi:hypothetical protein